MKSFKHLVSSCLIVCLTASGFPLTAQAGIIAIDEIATAGVTTANRDKVDAFLARDDVRQAMQAQGVSPLAATQRVKAM